jgi:phosphatidylserine decarboxylase
MKQHFSSYISKQFGKFASKQFSPSVQSFINKSYVRLMGLDMREFHAPETYTSLNALFTRNLHMPRHFSTDADDFISPCDSRITAFGTIEGDLALQIKGMQYSVNTLLGDHIDSDARQSVVDGDYANFYLSPRDYHRYHVPTNLKVLKSVHIPGKLYPVNIPSLNKRIDLFIENERVILECETQHHKKMFIVLVGALNVGKMQVSFEPRINTNADITLSQSFAYDDLFLNKGEDFGCFEMGSTIVILAQKETLKFDLEIDQKVKFGDTIAKIA